MDEKSCTNPLDHPLQSALFFFTTPSSIHHCLHIHFIDCVHFALYMGYWAQLHPDHIFGHSHHLGILVTLGLFYHTLSNSADFVPDRSGKSPTVGQRARHNGRLLHGIFGEYVGLLHWEKFSKSLNISSMPLLGFRVSQVLLETVSTPTSCHVCV